MAKVDKAVENKAEFYEAPKQAEPVRKIAEFKITKLKLGQTVVDLETGADADIDIESVRYEIPKYDQAIWGTVEEFDDALFKAATKLIGSKRGIVEAIVARATSMSYQNGKAAALSAGNYLTQELRGKIVNIMRMNQQFADLKASECYAKWLGAYKAGKPAALNFLTMAQAMTSESEVDL